MILRLGFAPPNVRPPHLMLHGSREDRDWTQGCDRPVPQSTVLDIRVRSRGEGLPWAFEAKEASMESTDR